MLERELAERGVSESSLWLEVELDHLHDTRAEQSELLVKGLISAGQLGIKAVKAIKGIREGGSLPDPSPPDWLQPPARAAWPATRQAQASWAEVQIDENSGEWLDRAYEAIPRLIGSTAFLEAWLDWSTDNERYLAVYIGEREVGRLDETATTAYEAVMKAASKRDESPYAHARLTPRPTPSGYLLEVQLPG